VSFRDKLEVMILNLEAGNPKTIERIVMKQINSALQSETAYI